MKKKKYIIIIISVITLTGVILFLSNNTKTNIFDEILKLNNYEIKIKDCSNTEKELPKEILTTISNNWNNLSNNGPWLGDTTACYKEITITYKENNTSKEIKILLVDESSLVLIHNNNTIYYTNSTNVNKTLNQQNNN